MQAFPSQYHWIKPFHNTKSNKITDTHLVAEQFNIKWKFETYIMYLTYLPCQAI